MFTSSLQLLRKLASTIVQSSFEQRSCSRRNGIQPKASGTHRPGPYCAGPLSKLCMAIVVRVKRVKRRPSASRESGCPATGEIRCLKSPWPDLQQRYNGPEKEIERRAHAQIFAHLARRRSIYGVSVDYLHYYASKALVDNSSSYKCDERVLKRYTAGLRGIVPTVEGETQVRSIVQYCIEQHRYYCVLPYNLLLYYVLRGTYIVRMIRTSPPRGSSKDSRPKILRALKSIYGVHAPGPQHWNPRRRRPAQWP